MWTIKSLINHQAFFFVCLEYSFPCFCTFGYLSTVSSWKSCQYFLSLNLILPCYFYNFTSSGSLFVSDFKAKGILPISLCNYVSRLGWSPPTSSDDYVFESFAELADNFDLASMNKQPTVIDIARLQYWNRRCLRAASSGTQARKEAHAVLETHVIPFLQKHIHSFDTTEPASLLGTTYLSKALDLACESLDSVANLHTDMAYLWFPPRNFVTALSSNTTLQTDPAQLDITTSLEIIQKLTTTIYDVPSFNPQHLKSATNQFAKTNKFVTSDYALSTWFMLTLALSFLFFFFIFLFFGTRLRMKQVLVTLRHILTGLTVSHIVWLCDGVTKYLMCIHVIDSQHVHIHLL